VDAEIYHIVPGISSRLAPVLIMPFGPSFHLSLNGTLYTLHVSATADGETDLGVILLEEVE